VTLSFYRTGDEYGYMSNFSAHPVEIDGKRWPTTEHYFQAQKYAGTEHEERVRAAKKPGDAARLGRDHSLPLRSDWEQVKDDVMRVAVRAKFTQHEDLRAGLLATGEETLVEQTTDDHYWGCGSSGTGKNMLGRILMEIRAELPCRCGRTGSR
jgi:N-glycosidase YbiA